MTCWRLFSLDDFSMAVDKQVESVVRSRVADRIDPSVAAGGLPNSSQAQFPHILSFVGLSSAISEVYRDADEALKSSIANARFMRNDVGIMECILARERMVALLPWHLKPEDGKSQSQKDLCNSLTKCLNCRRGMSWQSNIVAARRWVSRACNRRKS